MRKLFSLAVVSTLWLMFTGSAAAADIVYTLNDMVGGGSVVGTITTDGTPGPLSTIDIKSFNLMLTIGTSQATLASGNDSDAVFVGGGGLVATPTALMFNFENGAFVNFFSTSSCTPLWTLRGAGGQTCNGFSGTVDALATDANTEAMMTVTPGTEIPIGTAPSVPEPASLVTIVVGLVSVFGVRKLHF